MSTTPARISDPVVALDIGNVSMKLNFDEMYRRLDVDPSDASAVARLWEHGAAIETGHCTVPEFLDRLDAFTGHRHSRQELLDSWRCGVCEPMPGMLETVRALTACRVRISFLSDISPIHLEQVFRYCGFAHLISGGIYSFSAFQSSNCVAKFEAAIRYLLLNYKSSGG